jgi:hypothetical protein
MHRAPPQKARAVFRGSEARAQGFPVQRDAVDAANAPRGGFFVREGDVRRARHERGARLWRRGVDLQHLAELLEHARLAQRRLLAETRREPDDVHQVAPDHAHVEQPFAVRRAQTRTRGYVGAMNAFKRRVSARFRSRRALVFIEIRAGARPSSALRRAGRARPPRLAARVFARAQTRLGLARVLFSGAPAALRREVLLGRRVEPDGALVVLGAARRALPDFVGGVGLLHEMVPAPRAKLVPRTRTA